MYHNGSFKVGQLGTIYVMQFGLLHRECVPVHNFLLNMQNVTEYYCTQGVVLQ